jgi:hypothetical protein
MKGKRHLGVFFAVALIAAALATGGLAQSPSQTGYGGGGTVLGGVEDQGDSPGQASAGGTLPFTGIDLALLVGGGILLAGVGAALVRAGARSPAD